MAYRSSTGNLADFEDRAPRGPERWDRERFERYRSRGPDDRRGSSSVRFEEHDSHGPRRERRNTEINIDEHFGRGGTRVEVKDREYEDYRPARRRPEFLDRHEPTPSEVANLALAPYRKAVAREYEPPRRPARPQYIRRQSSLDTYDRKPLPRYGDREDDGWRPPKNVPIPLPIREPARRRDYHDDDYEEIRYLDSRPEYDEEYREVEIRRESSRRRKRGSKKSSKAPSVKAPSIRAPSPSSSSTSSFEEIISVHESAPPAPPKVGKKGKTRMPKRLVHKRAILERGLEFDEEEDFYVVKRALEKEHIDEIIKISENYKETSKVTYRYEERDVEESIAAPPPPPPPASVAPLPPPPVVEFAPPPPASVHSHHTHHHGFAPPPPPPPPASVHSHHTHHHTEIRAPRSEYFEERIEERQGESAHVNGPLTVFVPERRPRSDREIREEIRHLEEERRVVRIDRDEIEYVEVKPPRDVIRVEKDRKEIYVEERPRRKKDNSKIIAGMIATLT